MTVSTTETKMVNAHRLGRSHAGEYFAEMAQSAMRTFTSVDEQFSYLAGVIEELKRIAKKETESC